MNVTLPKSGEVRIVFVSDGKKKWHAFLCTDIELDSSDILTYYSRRWAIEVFFKDAKQMLYLGKEQSNIFDAVVASYSRVMIRYLLLVYILYKRNPIGCPMGPLFRELSDIHLQLFMVKKIWDYIKEFMITSTELISYEINPDIILHLLDIVEEAVIGQVQLLPAKL